MSAPPRLAVHDALGHRVVSIDKPVFTIGRGPGHDLQVAGSDVSRLHADIVLTGNRYEIRDRGSRFGTFVNGRRVEAQPLNAGDQIVCGRDGPVMIFLGAASPGDESSVPTAADLRQVATLLDALRQMGTDRVLEEVLTLVVDAAVAATGAERGFIMLANATGKLEMRLARGRGGLMLAEPQLKASSKVPDDVFATGRTSVVADLLDADVAALHTGTVALGIRQVLCAPLRLVRYRAADEVAPEPRNIGVLYMDSRERGRLLSPAARMALEALAAHAAIAIENARLYQEEIEKTRLDEELATASVIQRALLPEGRRESAFFQAVGASVPSRTIGGDFFDYQDLGAGGFGLGLGDVTGKGPPAALLAALVQGVLAAKAFTPSPPDQVIALVNRVLLARPIESRFLTLFLAVLAPGGLLTYCNAAHNPPLLFSASGLTRLDVGGTLVGAFPEAVYERGEVRLTSGDTLLLFSDGVAEAEDPDGREFGEQGIADAVRPVRDAAVDVILTRLLQAVRTFTRDAPPRDDLTAVVVRYL